MNTVEGNLLKKADNNKKLLYHNGLYDTSFVSLRVGSGSAAKDYLFGGKYDGSGKLAVEKSEGGEIVATWSVDGVTFTQTISLAADNVNEHGMVSIAIAAKNGSGKAVPVQARILFDTCLGDQDWAHYQINGGNVTKTMDTEQIITDEAALKSFYAIDDIADPQIAAYVVSTPTKAAIGHWNNLAASLFDFAPDTGMDFTNAINDYLTADSACALFYDMGTVQNGATQSVVSYYGVYSNHKVKAQNCVAVNTVAPMRLTLNKDKTAYVRESSVGKADFAVTVSAENYKSDTSRDLKNVVLAVRSTGGLRTLGDSGEILNNQDFDTADPLTVPYSLIAEGKTITKTLYFQANKVEEASYERVTVGMYQGEVTGENLLGEQSVYILLPGNDGSIPKICFNSMTPGTIYNAGTRHLYLAVTNALLLSDSLDAGNCAFKAYGPYYNKNGKQTRDSWDIPSDNISVNISEGVADIALTDDIKLPVGAFQLQLEWTDAAVSKGIVSKEYQKQTADKLKFEVSDNPKYKNDTYGVLAAIKYGKGTSQFPYYYRLKSFTDEASFKSFAESKEKDWVEIPLVFRGAFTMEQKYVERGENGKVMGGYYYSAVSKKTIDPATRQTKVDNPITINNCVDFEGGTIAIYYEDYKDSSKAVNSAICVEFDGDLYTSDARTSVWTGKAALTKLKQGGDFALTHYDANGNRKQSNSDPITLIWPNVFSLAQTLSGLAFKLAYGQFGVMESDGKEVGRVISFAASLSLSFLKSPAGDETDYGTASYFGRMQELWKDWRGASIYQYAYHGSRYEKLVDIGMNDKDKSNDNKKGVQGSVMIPDILFGCGQGFVGLNFSVGVTVQNMVDSLAKIEATLSINTINNWAFGFEGKCDLVKDISMEAKIKFKSYNNIPIPDELYFYAGGFDPGLCIDPCGVVWITGAGGGFSGLYDTIFYTGGVPPLKLIMTMGFAALQILKGTAKMEVSGSGVSITASNLKIRDAIEVVKKISVGLQWYPDLKLTGAVYISMFERCIEGQGYMIILGKDYTDWFFEMYVRAAIQVPSSVPVVGGMAIAAVDLGVSTEKIWGALEALKVVVGVTYYWGEDSVNFGSGVRAKPTYPNLLLSGYDGECEDYPVAYDEETGRTLYAHFGTNFEPPQGAQILSDDDLILMDSAGVWSTGEKTSHKFNLGSYAADTNESTVVQVTFDAGSLAEAKALANQFTVKDSEGKDFPKVLYNGSNLDDANANVTWDEETKKATFAFSVTDDSQFGKNWFISTGETPADVVLYNVLPVPELTAVTAPASVSAGGDAAITWSGSGLDELDSVSFFLVESDDPATADGYGLGGVTEGIEAGRASLTVPGSVPTGEYYLRAVYSKDDQLNGVIHSETKIKVENTNTPAAMGTPTAAPAGDLKLGVTVPATADANTAGYVATVYNADGSATDISEMFFDKAESGATEFQIGGSYTAPVKKETDDPDSANTGTETVGLEGGKQYIVGVTPYKMVDTDGDGEDDTVVYGAEKKTAAITLPKAVTPTATLTADGQTIRALKTMANALSLPTFTKDDLRISAKFSEAVTGAWTLDSSAILSGGEDDTVVSGSFSNTSGTTISLADLTDGDHTLNVSGQAQDGDRFAYSYVFTVDTVAPRLMLSSPLNGSLFGENGALEITGVTDSDALLTVKIDGQTVLDGKTVEAAGGDIDEDGVFALNVSIPNYNGAAYHAVEISAADENGNATEPQTVSVTHPGLGDLENLEVMVGGASPKDGNVSTMSSGSVKLSLVGVTSNGTRFVLDPDYVSWTCLAAEGEASVAGDGSLTYAANTQGFVEARIEVSAGAYRSAALTLGPVPGSGYVSVSASIGGTVDGGGYYSAGDTVKLTAKPDPDYVFDHWELSGVSVKDPTAAEISFRMPDGDVTATAVFRAAGEPGVELAYADVPDGVDANMYVPYYLDSKGKEVIIPISSVIGGRLMYLKPKDKTVYFKENPVSFNDIKSHWARKNILWTAAHGLFNGVGKDKFDPNGTMTRAMFVTVLYRVAQTPTVTGECRFTDVKKGSYYEKAVIWASNNGIVKGVSDTKFDPNADVTREQMCAFVARFLRTFNYSLTLGEKTVFNDDAKIAKWAKEDVEYCQRAGIINGKPGGIFDPKGKATRAENATVMKRMIEGILIGLKTPKAETKHPGQMKHLVE